MAFLKRIAQDPNEGADQTKDCPVCTGNGPKAGWCYGVNPAENEPFQCGTCGGTGKVHK